MNRVRFVVRPLSAFGTPLAGDTLFGHLCWALRWRHGEQALERWLEGYTAGQPFAVVSDAFPSGWVPRPAVPEWMFGLQLDPAQRKQWKRRAWLPFDGAGLPFAQWLARSAMLPPALRAVSGVVVQNTIDRLTGTTGSGAFAPRRVTRTVFASAAQLDLHVVFDAERIDLETLTQAWSDIGVAGYGRDASTGLGKFEVAPPEEFETLDPHFATAAMALAPCSPHPEALLAEHCFWQPLTRFGRHGSVAALASEAGPFKQPVLTMRTGAFLRFQSKAVPTFHGRGLGGVTDPLSARFPSTVHQGYAPLLPIRAEIQS